MCAFNEGTITVSIQSGNVIHIPCLKYVNNDISISLKIDMKLNNMKNKYFFPKYLREYNLLNV